MDRFQSAVDIKTSRMAAKFDRLEPEYLAGWRKDYALARADFIRGDINRVQLAECLESLGFRSDALKAEILDAERDKNNPDYEAPAVIRYFRYEFKR